MNGRRMCMGVRLNPRCVCDVFVMCLCCVYSRVNAVDELDGKVYRGRSFDINSILCNEQDGSPAIHHLNSSQMTVVFAVDFVDS